MTRPWQRPPEDQIVAVVHALQELLVGVTERSVRQWSWTVPGSGGSTLHGSGSSHDAAPL